MSDFEALTAAVLKFRDERDWRQFHSLRNLITSLNLEAAELLELTQWKSDADRRVARQRLDAKTDDSRDRQQQDEAQRKALDHEFQDGMHDDPGVTP